MHADADLESAYMPMCAATLAHVKALDQADLLCADHTVSAGHSRNITVT